MVRTEQLIYLDAAIRHESLRKAAAELGLAQPSLSQQILKLEEELNVVLLIRRANGVLPTDEALRLLPHAKDVLRAMDALKQRADALSGLNEGHVRLACTSTASRTFLPGVVRAFRDQYPRIDFQVSEGGSATVREFVKAGKADLGISSRFPDQDIDGPRLVSTTIASGRIDLCVPSSHRLATKHVVTVDDVVTDDFIVFHPGYALREAFDRWTVGRDVRAVYQTESSETARRLVAQGIGVSLLPRLGSLNSPDVDGEQVRLIPIAAAWVLTQMTLIRRANEQPSPAASKMHQLLAAAARALPAEE